MDIDSRIRTMTLTQVAGDCGGKDCPKVFQTDRGTLVFQGDTVASHAGLHFGPGEQAVELPLHLVKEAMDALGR